jgi:hypothetical protein
MSSASEDERNGDDNLTPNGDADQDLNEEMDDLFDEGVDAGAESKAQVTLNVFTIEHALTCY